MKKTIAAAALAALVGACASAGAVDIPDTTTTTTIPGSTTTTAAATPDLAQLDPSELPRSSTYSFVEVTVTGAALGKVQPRTYLTDTPVASDANHLFIHATLRNASFQDTANWVPSPFRLDVGGELIGPPEMLEGRPNLGLIALATDEVVLAFEVAEGAAFEVISLVLAEEDRIPMVIPLTGEVEPPPQPAELDLAGEGPAQGQGVGCRQSLDVTVLGGRTSIDLLDTDYPTAYGSRRALVGERFLSVDLRILNNGGSRCGGGATNFGNSDVVLWVDGVPRAPVTWVNVGIGAGVAEDLTFDFAYPTAAGTLELTVGSADGELFEVPVEVGG